MRFGEEKQKKCHRNADIECDGQLADAPPDLDIPRKRVISVSHADSCSFLVLSRVPQVMLTGVQTKLRQIGHITRRSDHISERTWRHIDCHFQAVCMLAPRNMNTSVRRRIDASGKLQVASLRGDPDPAETRC